MKVIYSEHFQAELCCITGRYSTENKELGRRFVQTVESACLEIAADPLRWRARGTTKRAAHACFPIFR